MERWCEEACRERKNSSVNVLGNGNLELWITRHDAVCLGHVESLG